MKTYTIEMNEWQCEMIAKALRAFPITSIDATSETGLGEDPIVEFCTLIEMFEDLPTLINQDEDQVHGFCF